MAESYSIVYIYHILLIQSSFNGHLGCFHILAIVNRAAMNMRVHVSLLSRALSGYMPKSGIVGSYGSSMYRFLRYLHTDLHSGCTSLHSHATVQEGSLYSTPPPALVICGLLNDGHSDFLLLQLCPKGSGTAEVRMHLLKTKQ